MESGSAQQRGGKLKPQEGKDALTHREGGGKSHRRWGRRTVEGGGEGGRGEGEIITPGHRYRRYTVSAPDVTPLV